MVAITSLIEHRRIPLDDGPGIRIILIMNDNHSVNESSRIYHFKREGILACIAELLIRKGFIGTL
jgi:hypothetical protein